MDLKYWEALSPRNIGPAGMSGRVTAIDVNPTDRDHIYVGTASGGVWMSRNGGISFEPIFDDQKYLGIGAVAVSDANPNVIWVGTGEGNPRNSANYGGGIYKSLDGGKTWKMMGLEATRHIHRVIVHPTNPDVVYVGAMGNMWYPNEERGVFRTKDGGKTWEKILYVDDGTGIADMIIDPSNPNKIIAATWTFDRDPDYFNSGGPGSGIWITHDGGDSWERKTAKHGLPKGDLGRIGLTIGTNKPNILYALVEAKENGLYKSTDGGANWKLVSTKNIGGRPFYYAELYVDPQNENRIYNVHTYIDKSEDGGKSFRQIAGYGNGVHPDHHAFWIDPNDPEYIIDGNDGGLNISHDGGDTWRFAANLPLAQLYHINYDMSFPYLVGGGMQDNGSWVGPSQGLKSGGITDSDWQEVYFGDGFDLIFKPGSKKMVYAASQGGALGRVNRETGKTIGIKPVHPDGTFLRFNWNAPIAQSTESDCTIYMGSQFVHKSTDCGDNWTIISPDLTTNDSLRQRSMISGGLTIDATQAENHTTLLAIVPTKSNTPEGRGLWVSSDDGKLHFSPNDGGTWNDLSKNLPGMKEGAWIPYVEASEHNPAEAWVIVNDFRRGDTKPYVYHTTDYGQTFRQIIKSDGAVVGHTLAIVQDPVEPNLLFLGTDQGLFISFDKGAKWTHYDQNYPHVSTRDMKIHPREHDLIIGTFGRAVWIMDDIRPLREIAKQGTKMLKDTFAVFPAPDAYQWETRSYQGVRFYAQGQFQGQDRRRGAMLTYWVLPEEGKKGGKGKGMKADATKEEMAGKGKRKKGKKGEAAGAMEVEKEQGPDVSRLLRYSVTEDPAEAEMLTADDKDPNAPMRNKKKMTIQVVDVQSGDTIRTYKTTPKYGMNRTSWNMRRDGISFPSRRAPRPDAGTPSGAQVPPGVYEVVMTFNGHVGKTMLTIHPDPREEPVPNAFAAREELTAKYDTTVVHLTTAWDDLQAAGKSLTRVQGLLKDAPEAVKDSLSADIKDLKKEIARIEEIYTEKEGLKGIQRNPTNLQAQMFTARRYIGQVEGKASQMATVTLSQFQEGAEDFIKEVEGFISGDFSAFRREVEAADLSLFGKL
ncbi:hypothetical protein FUA23_08395 [Neolewinella aurantiaca]|uniref:Sortilin N-terminal domain-containing protein n=1 Tax=Neolewinella aurantiaca TaxID=2602767 RepID=A0A5C7FGE4_9BACT|nr:hypothetical protein FUA23_08395 [Neolewinella aurantiaca]